MHFLLKFKIFQQFETVRKKERVTFIYERKKGKVQYIKNMVTGFSDNKKI